ncbi:MAG TPA: hypothetical protein DDY14_07790 [Chromatiaceae bacterium]|jgi:hypothetical protein|nr:MAG: hypothetical protein N838_10685 [Thiohalocapsa sp. PB-PSB1]QQO56210.1 MAG: hypothetical protein N838_25465 [Thiohalocapsa sp. PB-PSB1]HBG95215.1 hypothetical protein [Chromatiaceae bacterium]HCS92002.1 hypothetical protein [Chromatiaceae bacterium]
MKTNKLIQAVVLILCLVSAGVYFTLDDRQRTNDSTAVSDLDSAPLVAGEHQTLKHPECGVGMDRASDVDRNTLLAQERRIEELQKQVEELQQRLAERSRNNSDQQIAIVNPMESEMDLADIDVNEFGKGNRGWVALELEQQLTDERYDPEWAQPMEAEIAEVVTPELQADGNELLDTLCGSTFCRVEIGHENEQAESKFLLALASRNELIGSFGDLFVHRVPPEIGGDSIHSVFYVAREGHRLPVPASGQEH